MQKKIAPEELAERVDADYFGFRDEDDGSLLAYENVLETREISKYVANASEGVMQELRREFVPEPASVSKPQLEAWLVKRRQQELANRFSEGVF